MNSHRLRLRATLPLLAILTIAGCVRATPSTAVFRDDAAVAELVRLHDRHRVPALTTRRFTQRGATIVLPGIEPYRADLSINFADALAHRDGRITEVGDLAEAAARDTIDASGMYLHTAAYLLVQ